MEFHRYWPLVYVVFISVIPFIYTQENAPEDYVSIHDVVRNEAGNIRKCGPGCADNAPANNCDANSKPDDYVKAHNVARKEVGLDPITWNETVAKFAQYYANKRIADCALIHSDCNDQQYGENLAIGGSGKDAVTMWVNEKPDYDYASNTCAPSKCCGHYTQVVWRNSTQLGCARVKCANNIAYFVICNYWPPGNYIDTKPY
ncbi:pathogenesis-related leaf protein 4-like [Bidens hawaiensis]|uniref:pathogenesis-related leaf protein 4-like n=1 Tax=Bidens hawaiensis TaxID=980011 RepID=UPI0040495AAF